MKNATYRLLSEGKLEKSGIVPVNWFLKIFLPKRLILYIGKKSKSKSYNTWRFGKFVKSGIVPFKLLL